MEPGPIRSGGPGQSTGATEGDESNLDPLRIQVASVGDYGSEPGFTSREAPHSRTSDVLGKRIAAFLIDAALVIIAGFLVLGFVQLAVELPYGFQWFPYFGFLVYKIAGEAISGRTLGKRLMNNEVTSESGGPVGFVAACVRNLLLIPGVFLLYIPSHLMIEYSSKNQRLGDLAARTLVVAPVKPTGVEIAPHPDVASSRALAPQPAVVPWQPEQPAIVQSRDSDRKSEEWRRLLSGGAAEAATFVLFVGLLTIQFATGASKGSLECYPSSRAPIWPHGDVATGIVIILGVMSVLVLPAVVGFRSRSWSWLLLCPAMLYAIFLPSYLVGASVAESRYSEFQSGECGAGYLLIFAWIFLPAIAGIPAMLGTVAGRMRKGS